MKLNGPPQKFYRRIVLCVVASCGCARMGGADDDCPKETRDDYSSKNTGRDCGVGFGCAGDDVAGECSDRAGMQRQIPGCQNRRHARRPEVERLPESPMRRRRCAGCRRRSGGCTRCGSGRRAEGSRQERIQEGSQGGCGAGCAVRPRGLSERRRFRNIPRRPPARRACTPAWTSTMPTRPPTPMAG